MRVGAANFMMLTDAVRLNPAFNATEKDVTDAVRKWLVNSRDREGHRRSKTAPEEQQST